MGRRRGAVAAILCIGAAAMAPHAWSRTAGTVERGQSIVTALEILRRDGLELLYSDVLVPSELRVEVDPGRGDPVSVASRILATPGLALRPARPGLYVVVRAAPEVRSGVGVADEGAVADTGPLEEITIYASHHRVRPDAGRAAAELSRTELALLPGLDEDALRVTRFLPGAASNGLSARTYLRGGADDESGVYFDGVPLFAPYHFKDFSAALGVIDPSTVDRMEFYGGVFPARFGDRLSGITDLAPRRSAVGLLELSASVFAAKALGVGRAEWRDAPVDWLAATRVSTLELVAEAAGREGVEPDFRELLLRAEREGEDWRVAVGALAWTDDLRVSDVDSDRREAASAAYRDATFWINADRAFSPELALSTTVATVHRRTDRSGSLEQPGIVAGNTREDREVETAFARVEILAGQRWTAGFEALRTDARFDFATQADFAPTLARAFSRPDRVRRSGRVESEGSHLALYASRLLQPSERLRIHAGLRLDWRDYSADSGAGTVGLIAPTRDLDAAELSPRLAVQYDWSARTTFRASVGRVTQSARPDELRVADGDAAYHGVQKGDQFVLAAEHRLGEGGQVRLEAYRKDVRDPAPRFENLLDPVSLLPELEIDRQRLTPRSARTYGVELSSRWTRGPRWSGWASYSWSEVNDVFDSGSVPRSWNQLHALTAGLAWADPTWSFSANLYWHSGWRRTPLRLDGPRLTLASRNSGSWPDYLSLDLRATWTRPLPRGRLRAYADLVNASNRANDCCLELSVAPGDGTVGAQRRGWLPRYAVVGVTWELP